MNKVLIIEDEIATARPVKEALEIEGFSVDIAEDGIQGLKMFNEKRYDLILLDLKMPKMDGYEVLKEVRKINPFIDIIIYTNNREFTNIKELTNIGIDGYIDKGPKTDLNELIDLIIHKLSPLNEAQAEQLIKNTPSDLFNK